MPARIFVSILKISPKFKKAIWKRVYQFLASKYQTEDWTFMNYGYQSLNESEKVELKKEDEVNRFFIQLYHYVASKVELKNKMVLEVGSGKDVCGWLGLPYCFIQSTGDFSCIGYICSWLSSSELNAYRSWSRGFSDKNHNLHGHNFFKKNGFSVRSLKN